MFQKIKKSFKKLISEYKQVKWPSLKTTINLALYVIIVSVIITLMIIGLDSLFYTLRAKYIIG
jgi:preprotein translocase SecE subunit